MSPYCNKCKHTGLLPFIKDGRVIPNAYTNCECRHEETDYYHRIRPEDIDSPVSDTYRGFAYEIAGRDDPGATPGTREPEQSPSAPEPEWTQRQWEYVKQLRGMVNHLNHKVTELEAVKKTKGGRYQKYVAT